MKGENLSLLEKQQLVESYQSEIKKLQFQLSLLKETVKQLKEGIKEDKKAPIAASAAAIVSSIESAAPKAKRGPGRPRKASSSATTAKKKRGRPKKTESEPVTPKRKRGRPKKTESATAAPKKKRGRPKKSTVVEAKVAKPASETKSAKKRGPGRPKGSTKKTPPSQAKSSAPKKRGRKPNQKLGGYRLSDWDQLIVNGITKAGKALIKNELLELADEKNKAENLKMDMQAINVKISQSLHKLANRRDDLIKIPFPGRGFAYALSNWKTSKGNIPKKYQR